MKLTLYLFLILLTTTCGNNDRGKSKRNTNSSTKNLQNTIKTKEIDELTKEENNDKLDNEEPTQETPKVKDLIGNFQDNCKEGDLEEVRRLIEKMKTAQQSNTYLPIHKKIFAPNYTKKVLKSKNNEGKSLLMITLDGYKTALKGNKTTAMPNPERKREEYVKIFELLIQEGVPTNQKDKNGLKVIHYFTELDINSNEKEKDLTKMIQALNKAPKSLEQENKNGETSLQIATRKNKTRLIRVLIKNNALIGKILFTAIESTHKGALKEILNNLHDDIFLTTTNKNKETPLQVSIRESTDTQLTQLLIDKLKKLNTTTPEKLPPGIFLRDKTKRTVLHYAVKKGKNKAVEVLLKAFGKFGIKDVLDKEHKTALQIAKDNHQDKIVELLS